jgi:hypothetical protein
MRVDQRRTLALLLIAAASPCSALLLNPSVWANSVPTILPQGSQDATWLLNPSLVPNFAEPSADLAGSEPGPAEATGDVAGLAALEEALLERSRILEGRVEAPLPKLPDLPQLAPLHMPNMKQITAAEKRMLGEGQQIWETLDKIRTQILDDPNLLASREGKLLLEDFQRRYRKLEGISAKLGMDINAKTQPFVMHAVKNFGRALAPLHKFADSAGDIWRREALGFFISPAMVQAAAHLQLVTGLVAVADAVYVANKIRSTVRILALHHSHRVTQ